MLHTAHAMHASNLSTNLNAIEARRKEADKDAESSSSDANSTPSKQTTGPSVPTVAVGTAGALPPLPTFVRAVVVARFDQNMQNALEIQRRPVPSPKDDEVLVAVRAGSVNPVDWKMASGALAIFSQKPPYVAGSDMSGIVARVGSKCTRVKVGDEIYADRGADVQGAHKQFVVLPERQVALKPKTLSFVEAGAVPLAALTALQAFTRHSDVKEGYKVVVIGGSGGVGHFALQIAKILGALEIVAVASSQKADFCRQMGATLVIEYDQKKEFGELLNGQNFDVVFDTVGGKTQWIQAQKVLKRGGIFITIANDRQCNPETHRLDVPTILTVGASVLGRKIMSLNPLGSQHAYKTFMLDAKSDQTRHELDRLSRWFDSSRLKVHIEKVFDFDQVWEMYTLSKEGHCTGKLSLQIPQGTA